nr:uncharacterized protein LOC104116161 [Nicotiana tomentosiformis]
MEHAVLGAIITFFSLGFWIRSSVASFFHILLSKIFFFNRNAGSLVSRDEIRLKKECSEIQGNKRRRSTNVRSAEEIASRKIPSAATNQDENFCRTFSNVRTARQKWVKSRRSENMQKYQVQEPL